MNLAQIFAESAKRNSEKPALFWGEDEYSYNQIFAQGMWIAQRLQRDFAIKPGDRVALWLKNCPQYVPAVFGVLHAGAVVVPINNFLKPDEVAFILGDCEVSAMISDGSMAEGVSKLATARPGMKVINIEEIPAQGSPQHAAAPACSQSDLAVIIYTSGTTGRPKGAMLSHGNLIANVESCREVLRAVGEDRFVVLLPMFHSFMMTVGILLPTTVGGSIVLIRSVHPPKNIIQEIVQRKATILPAVPQLFRTFTHPSIPATMPLRLCISGAAPLPAEILKEFTTKFPFPLVEGYGLSEASPVVTFNPLDRQKAGSIGKPIPGVEVTIQSEAGEILPNGQTGEICVRGGNVMQGYWNQPAETAKVMRDGWLLTGDVGHKDEEGYFFITDRKKDMLLVNGINVYPREIEEILYQFPGVREAAVIGVPDPRKGEQPIAFFSANEGARVDEKALLQFVRERLADYKVPKRAICMPALPRNATGKILKTELRQLAAKQSEAAA